MVTLFALLNNNSQAQYAPPAGQPGTTAIAGDSSVFIDWASDCEIMLGFVDISNEILGYPKVGDNTSAIGSYDFNIVSLGDGGTAILSFSTPIANGVGWDFAVFENSFSHDFLELATVEVSSNGYDYFAFNSTSLTPFNHQVESFGTLAAENLNNLAGKYIGGYGVPFDLEELAAYENLNIDSIVSVKITDVIGCVDTNYATYDSQGNIINDPWPTPFESSGFDLDAVGVINNRNNTGTSEIIYKRRSVIYPNPCTSYFQFKQIENIQQVEIFDLNGSVVKSVLLPDNKIDVSTLKAGFYTIIVITNDSIYSAMLSKL